MTFLEFRRTRIGFQSHTRKGTSAANSRLGTRQRAVLEFIGTIFVLMAIAIGIPTPRFALVLIHGVLHWAKAHHVSLQSRICHDVWGTWSVQSLSPVPVSHLPSLAASIDYACKGCNAAPATIELFIDGMYLAVHQERGWPRRLLSPETDREAQPRQDGV